MNKRLLSILIMCAMIITSLGLTTVPVSAAAASKYVALEQCWQRAIKQKVGDYYIWIDRSGDKERIKTAKTLSAAPKTIKTVEGKQSLDSAIITNGYTMYYAVYNNDKKESATIYKTNVKKSYTKKLATINDFYYLVGFYDGRLYYSMGDQNAGSKICKMNVSSKIKTTVMKDYVVMSSEGSNFVITDYEDTYCYNVENGTKNVLPMAENYRIKGDKIYAFDYYSAYDSEDNSDSIDGIVLKEFSLDGTESEEIGRFPWDQCDMIFFGNNEAFFENSSGQLFKYNYKTCDFSKYITKLGQVKGMSAVSVNHNTVNIKWNSVADAQNYQVYRATSKYGTYKLTATTSDTSYTNTSLKTGKTYYYKVRAKGTDVYGSFSAIDPAKPVLNKVSSLTASAGAGSVTLNWTAVTGAKGYQIYRATSKSGKYTKIKSVTGTAFTNSGLTGNKTYYYKVRAYKIVDGSTKYGNFSSIVSCKTKSTFNAKQTEMLKQVNAKRTAKGLKPLKLYAPVNKTAQTKAKDLYNTGIFDHYSPNLGYVDDQLNRAGISWYACGENIAYCGERVSEVMDLWMNSPGHKANILSKNFTHLGVGYYNGYWVQQFIGK